MKSSDTSERIADIALSFLESDGPEAVTMRRVADAAGITPMAIYHHYPNREALLDAVTSREFGKFLGYITARPEKDSAEADLTGLMEAYLDYAFDRPRIFDYIFSQYRPGARRYPDDFRARRSPTLNPVADRVQEAMREGRFRKDDKWEVALELWALTHGYLTLYRGGRFNLSEKEFRALVRRALRRLIRGFIAK